MTYHKWLTRWLSACVEQNVKPTTYDKYKSVINVHILPYLGDYEINDLTVSVLQKFITDMSKICHQNTVNYIFAIVKRSLKSAAASGLICSQSADFVVTPKRLKSTVTGFTAEEQNKIERYILKERNPKLYGILFCLYTGLRIGELLALTWNDIDIAAMTIHVEKTCYDSWEGCRYKKLIDKPKTEFSARTVPVPKQLQPILRSLRARSKGAYLISGRSVYGMQKRIYQRIFSEMLERLQIKHKGFHSLRHTFAIRAIECGIDIKTIADILGHKTPSFTLQRYAHSFMQHRQQAVNRLGERLNLIDLPKRL